MGIAVDTTSVYWADITGGRVLKVGKDGGAVTTLFAGSEGPLAVAVDDSHVFWTTDQIGGNVEKVPLAGGSPTVVAPAQSNSYGIALNSTTVYWTNNGATGVMWIAK
jgi:sugar lactone lactonase YvrE